MANLALDDADLSAKKRGQRVCQGENFKGWLIVCGVSDTGPGGGAVLAAGEAADGAAIDGAAAVASGFFG